LMMDSSTIIALATPQGVGAIGVIRLSGSKAIAITQSVWRGKDLTLQPSHTIHYGHIVDGDKDLDEVMVSLFRAPKSFTTEDVVEISCHGSPFIVEQILQLLISKGARMATPGEFTLRAFMNGRIDLAQAEAVADLIASNSAAAQDIAIKQIRGGFANQIKDLRAQLVNFASLIELELDFSEEDVEFVHRNELEKLIGKIKTVLKPLIESFKLGNVIKNGVNVVIAGKPNAGKSTLLNALLNEERAIVSHIAGTTRDTIEEVLNIDGVLFRFIDTAGLRTTNDSIEAMGVQKSIEKIDMADLVVYLYDVNTTAADNLKLEIEDLNIADEKLLVVGNKADLAASNLKNELTDIYISAREKEGIAELKKAFVEKVIDKTLASQNTIVANIRHYEALKNAYHSLDKVLEGIDTRITTDLIAFELRQALDSLGEISGEVTNDEILGNIFSKFCIGK
jgi:tRNA modification GTPase